MDSRYNDLAKVLCGFSIDLKKGQKVLLDVADVPEEFVVALIRASRALGAVPLVNFQKPRINRELVRHGVAEQFKLSNEFELARMKKMDGYIAVRGAENIFESSDVPASLAKSYAQAMQPTLDWRVNKTKWVVLRWPTSSMAQQAKMSTEAFANFFFKVCTLDYSRMTAGMDALSEVMMKVKDVHLTSPGTDLRFSIKGMNAIPCGGKHNIPDGEVFTAPIKDSVEGVIQYNAPTIYQGVSFENIRLVFKKGKIVEATSNNTKRLNEILDTDAGARYIGEFAIGFNPHILHPMQDILFDEKIAGSFHFTPGMCYETTDNGNQSSIHWDMVCIQRPEYGGGEIRFDGKVIRKDGLFVPKSLQKLNPDYLLGKKTLMPPKFKPANKPSPGSIKHKPQTRKASPKVLRPKREPKKVSRSGNKRAPTKLAAEHEIHEVKVASDVQPARADKILSGLLSGISRSRVQKALDLGLITRDGEAIDRRTVLQPLDELTVALPAPEEPSATAVKMKLEVLFEDAHIIAINKPSGLLTHPVQGSDELSVVHGLLHHTKGKLAPAGGAPRPGVVHRLDRETSGVIVLAKTDKAYHNLVNQFGERTAQKEYLALVDKSPRLLGGQINANIDRHRTVRVRMAVREDGRHEAVTDWRVEEKYGPQAALIRAFPHTGRTHQIRVHLAHIGHAILGDRTYGKFDVPAFDGWPMPRVMLHAHRLTLNHPQTGKPMTFSVEPPKDFKTLQSWLINRFGVRAFSTV